MTFKSLGWRTLKKQQITWLLGLIFKQDKKLETLTETSDFTDGSRNQLPIQEEGRVDPSPVGGKDNQLSLIILPLFSLIIDER